MRSKISLAASILLLFGFAGLAVADPGLKDTAGWERHQTNLYKNWKHGERVKFRSMASDGAGITGNLYKPKGKGPFPAVVLLHGFGGVFPYQENWAYRLSQYGYVTLMVDGYCERGLRCLRLGRTRGSAAWKKMRESAFRVGDAQAGMAWLSQQPYVDKTRIGAFGFSRGAMAVIEAAAKGSPVPVKALVALYPQNTRTISKSGGWTIPTILVVPTAKSSSDRGNQVREMIRKFYPRDGFSVELLSLPDTTTKYDQPGKEIFFPGGQRLFRKYNAAATAVTEKRAVELFHKHLGGSLTAAK